MILTAGLTPAWQQIMRFERFRVGEVNRALETHWCASGKVLNVAIALAHLGADGQTISLLGGPAMPLIEREFAALCIARRWIETASPTRICTTILDQETKQTTELVENAAGVTQSELRNFVEAYREAVAHATLAILTGSLPAGTASTFFGDLLRETSCPAILDIRGPELLACLPYRPFLVKPNREELGRTLNRELADEAKTRAAMAELIAAGAQWVVVTSGAEPLLAACAEECYRIHPRQISVVNPIGSGDCLAAGIAWGLSRGSSVIDAIRTGVAAASENAAALLPARLDPSSVLQAAREVTYERIA